MEGTAKKAETEWRSRALWVQDTEMRHLISSTGDGRVVLQTQTGDICRYSHAEFALEFIPFGDDQVFKPAFHPLKAIAFACDTEVFENGKVLSVPRGDALLEHRNGSVEIIPRRKFNQRYRIVGHSSPDAPIAPFFSIS